MSGVEFARSWREKENWKDNNSGAVLPGVVVSHYSLFTIRTS